MQKKRKILYFVAVFLVIIIATIITLYHFATTKKVNEVVVAYNLEFKSKDPQKNADGWSTSITRQINTTLTSVNKSDQIDLANAKEIVISNDEKTYTITLNNDYMWEDGQKIKAQDYLFAIKHLLDPKLKSEYVNYAIDNIIGANNYYIKKSSKISGIKVISDNKIEFNLKKPVPYFTKLLASNVFSPLREDFYNKHKDNYGTSWDNVLSSGLYRVANFKKRQFINLVHNKYAKKANNLRIDKIKFVKVDSKLTEYNLFQTNKLTTFIETKKIGRLPEDNRMIDKSEMNYLVPNNKEVSRNLAKAAYLALDKNYISQKLLEEYGKSTATIYPSSFNKGYSLEGQNIFDFKQAKQIIANEKRKEIKLLVDFAYNKNVLKYIVNQFEAIGLKVNVITNLPRLVDNQIYRKANTKRDYDFALTTWNANYNDINAFTKEFINKDLNYINKDDKKFNELLNNVDSKTNDYNIAKSYLLPLWQSRVKVYYRNNVFVLSNNGYFLNAMYWN